MDDRQKYLNVANDDGVSVAVEEVLAFGIAVDDQGNAPHRPWQRGQCANCKGRTC